MDHPPTHFRRLLVVLLSAALGAAAARAESRNLVRTLAIWTQPSEDRGIRGVTLEAESAVGLSASWEYLLRPSVGVELAASSGHHDVIVMSRDSHVDIGGLRVEPTTLMVNVHSQAASRSTIYVGAGIAYTEYGKLELTAIAPVVGLFEVEEDWALAAQLGLDLQVGERWGLSCGVKYFEAEARTDDNELELPIKPWIGWIGAHIRF